MPATAARPRALAMAGDLDAQVHETHTGVVILLGEKAYKAQETRDHRLSRLQHPRKSATCLRARSNSQSAARPAELSRVWPSSSVRQASRPNRLSRCAATPTPLGWHRLVEAGEPVLQLLCVIAEMLAQFHREATRGPAIDAEGRPDAISARWHQNLAELEQHRNGHLSSEARSPS